jgi:hypothetical protein
MNPSLLAEHVADWHTQLKVDRTQRLVHNVALTGGTSKNGYRYTEQALRDAAPLYEQRPVFLDHAADKLRPQERSTRDLVGSIVNPRYESGRIRGDIRVLDTDSGRTFLALAESDAPGVGMSHVVLAERARPGGAVARIHNVISVDAVIFPATTTTFRESQQPGESISEAADKLTEVELTHLASGASDRAATRMVRAANDDRPQVETEPQSTHGLHVRLQRLLNERDELLARLRDGQRQYGAEQQQHALAELLSESGLPDFAVTETFRQQLLAADAFVRQQLVQERRQLIEQARCRSPVSHERMTSSPSAPQDAVFVATIKRRAL